MVVGIFSRMLAAEIPAQLDQNYIAIEVEAEPIELGQSIESEVRLIDEDGHILTARQGTLEFPPSDEPYPMRIFFVIPIPWDENFRLNEGMYRFDFLLWPGEEREQVLGGETLMVAHNRVPPPWASG